MYDSQKTSTGSAAADLAAPGRKIGGTTLIPQLAAEPAARRPMFEAEPAWEPIDAAPAPAPAQVAEPPLPSPSLALKASHAVRAEAASVPSAPTSDAVDVTGDPADDGHAEASPAVARAASAPAAARSAPAAAAKDPLGIAGHTDAHAAPFEHKHAHAERGHAAVDGYNRGTVHSDHAAAHVFGRPGAVSHGHGLFQLKRDAYRYTYAAQGHVNVAEPFDVIHKAKLLSINPKAPHLTKAEKHKLKTEQAAGKQFRLALNPSMPRQLRIGTTDTWCVLSWIDGEGGGAAWIPVKDLVGNTQQIHADVGHRAAHEDPSLKLSASTQYLIRDDAPGQADPTDKRKGGRVLAAGAKGGDNVSHYLEKGVGKPAFEAGKPNGERTTRGFVAVCMNLPEGGTPPVAIDTALAGEAFFAFNDKKFHREVAVFENGKSTSGLTQTWVFGHLGRQKGGAGPDAAQLEPDPKRAGWVPLRVLKLA